MFRKLAILINCLFCTAFGATTAPTPALAETEALTARQRAIVPISALTATGDIDRLKPALEAGLEAGLTVNEIKEILVQMYAYAGFPRSLNGLAAFLGVVDARKARGIEDIAGPEASPLPAGKPLRELGTDIQTQLFGPVHGRLFDFAPAADAFLKDHLFGDIFGRDVLTHQERELATVAALAAMRGTEGQLVAHCGAALAVGITAAQLRGVAATLRATVDTVAGKAMTDGLDKALANRKS